MECQVSDLDLSFFSGSTKSIARRLLGTYLVSESKKGRIVGRIVETEAYLFRNDPACHAHKGMTKRNATMFGPPGRGYVYLIYGMYHCFNVVTANEGVGEAVLVRALEPVEGLELMRNLRGLKRADQELCSGPGKLCQALDISKRDDGCCLQTSRLKVFGYDSFKPGGKKPKASQIVETTRIGISAGKELPLRFYLADNEFISKK